MSGEDAVRMYLQFLADPQELVDRDALNKLESNVEKAKDPITKLRAIAALERARNVDGSSYETAFVLHAQDWAATEGIPVAAFSSMGVPDAVLARAGLKPRNDRVAARARSQRGGRARSTSTETLQAWVLERVAPFTLAELQQNVGGSPATLKKAVEQLIAAGKVQNLGSSPSHAGRGRAPYLYQTIR